MFEASANGKTGILIPFNGKLFFRMYNDDRSFFIDYEVHHPDLEITIVDDSASFIENDGRYIIDISSSALMPT